MKSINWKKWSKELALFVVLFAGITWWQTKDMLAADGSYVVNLPTSTYKDLQGNITEFVPRGEKTLVYFFAPWCNVCALSIGNLENIIEPDLNIVAVALDYENQEDVKLFVDEHAVKAKVIMGDQALKRQFKIKGYPSYYLIDEDHKVVGRSYGYSSSIGLNVRNWLSF